MAYHTSLEVHYLHDQIAKILTDAGYPHRLAMYEQGTRFRIARLNNVYSHEEAPYFDREYGNMTVDRAYAFLSGYLAGLDVGMSIPN